MRCLCNDCSVQLVPKVVKTGNEKIRIINLSYVFADILQYKHKHRVYIIDNLDNTELAYKWIHHRSGSKQQDPFKR